ncbi:MAG: hypothetical protein SFV22_17940 [Saprospiraceae bacterium]|nr:hypothetical protein [Saprospiraceae bacterium]
MINYYPALEQDAVYHIYNRGNNRENIFYSPQNRNYFLEKYARYMSGVLDTYAYNLLPNHFHLLVKVKRKEDFVIDLPGFENLEGLDAGDIVSELFRRFFMSYAKAINKQEGRVGSLFQKNFKRRLVQSDPHFIHLIYYIHANAQLHDLCMDFRDWPYSSYPSMLSSSPTRLIRQYVLDKFESRQAFERYHQAYINLKNIEDLIIED